MKNYRPKKPAKVTPATKPATKAQPVHARVLVTQVLRPVSHQRGNKIEQHWFLAGVILPEAPDASVTAHELPIRIVRENWGGKLSNATPGTVISIEGFFRKFHGVLELHIVRGEVESWPTYTDNYKPTQRPDGTWRWLSGISEDPCSISAGA